MLQNVFVYYTPVELKHLVAVSLTRSVAASLDISCSLTPSLSFGNYTCLVNPEYSNIISKTSKRLKNVCTPGIYFK